MVLCTASATTDVTLVNVTIFCSCDLWRFAEFRLFRGTLVIFYSSSEAWSSGEGGRQGVVVETGRTVVHVTISRVRLSVKSVGQF